jgi:glycosyltransferase involved in cell wall biosynthesis
LTTVMLVAPYFPPDMGGLEQYVESLARQMYERHGWRVVVVATAGSLPQSSSAPMLSDVGYARVYRIPRTARISNTPVGLRWPRMLREIIDREHVDIVNAHAPVPVLADVAARCHGGVPFILTYHAGPMRNGHFLYDVVCGTYERFVLPRTAQLADHIICSSDYVAQSFSKFAEKCTTISPGVDIEMFRDAGQRDPQRVLFVGSLAKAAHYKGLPDLIAAIARLKGDGTMVRLEVAGDGDAAADHMALCRRLNVDDIVTFAGQLDRSQLAAAYRRASVVALPSHYDSFPTVLVEAMATARPVVSTAVGGIPTLVDNGENGVLLAPGDVPALARTIATLLENRSLALEMGRRGALKVRSELSWAAQSDRTCAVFERALNRRRGMAERGGDVLH